ncbi:MAG: hypothetical protein AAFX87_22080 [Bacteroidota bacterium]
MKNLIPLIICFIANSALGQNIEFRDCDNLGEPDWTARRAHTKSLGLVPTGATIREYDANLKSITPRISNYRYVLDKLY